MKKLALVALLATGCAVHAQQLADLSLHTNARVAQSAHSFVIYPFEDARGAEYAVSSPEKYIPVVNWFHQAREAFYPESAGMLRTRAGGGHAVAVGSLGAAMPTLLAGVMRKMSLAPQISVGEGPSTQASDFDYVVTGRVLRTHFREDESAALAVALGILGVPYRFAKYDLAYEVNVYDNRDPRVPIFSRTYSTSQKRAIGLYYNHEWAYPMFVGALERTLPTVVEDVAAIVAARS